MVIIEEFEADLGIYRFYMIFGIIGFSFITCYLAVKLIFYFKELLRIKVKSDEHIDESSSHSKKRIIYIKIIINSAVLGLMLLILIMMIISYFTI